MKDSQQLPRDTKRPVNLQSSQYNTDAAAVATVKSMFCAEFCGICITLGVSGVTDTLMLK